MIDKIIEFSCKNKYFVIISTLAITFGAIYVIKNIPLDAIPDLSDTQVIIYSRWDRSPDIIEDQVTYPIITALLGIPKIKDIRGYSDFGFSYVYVIFKDGTDIYWARSRVLEYLSKILPKLPEGVHTEIGPDATGVGWVYQYALVDKSGNNDLSELRSFQDWYLKYWLESVPGVAEVASIGGFQKQYQVNIDPNVLLAYHIPLMKVVQAIRDGNNEVGGRLIEFSGREYMVRGRGYIKTVHDIENIVVGNTMSGTPILVKHIGKVVIGPQIRRGVADLDGEGDTVGGIVIMRQGENALKVINRVKKKIEEIKPSLPKGVEIVTTYDRSELIKRSIETLKHELIHEILIVSFVIFVFLWHFPSSIIPVITIPIAVLLAFIPMYWMKLTTNIMSLAGIAISIGVLVDGAIIQMENVYKKLQLWDAGGRRGDYHTVMLNALKEVGPAIFFSLLIIAVSFLPVFTLVDQEGRLFRPLAYSKNFAMAIAAILSITLTAAMRILFTRMDYKHFKPKFLSRIYNALTVGKYIPEEKHPISNILIRIYKPVCNWALEHKAFVLIGSVVLMLSTVPVYFKLGQEFMPPLNEGSILYMPTTLPGISVTETQKLLQTMDKVIKTVPEVERVFGKAGRAESSTDPAPFSMVETTIVLKPEDQWRKVKRWYSNLPEILQKPFRPIWKDRITWEDIINELDSKMQFPGVSNAWTMPIKGRIDMLSTGIRTPIGIKIYGADLKEIEKIGIQVEKILRDIKWTRNVYAERVAEGYFVDFDIKREEIARYGLTIKDVEMVIMTAIGGEPITTTIEGRERYTVNVRYSSELRDSLDKLRQVLVPTMSGAQIPLGQLADIHLSLGPSMIRDENGMLTGYVYVDIAGVDIGSYVSLAKRMVKERLKLPPGYSLVWSGQYENMLRVKERLKVVIPLTIFIILILLYMNTKSAVKTCIVMLAVPLSLIGAVWILYLLDYNISIAVWVGMIALMGLDAEAGIVMLLFLDIAYKDMVKEGRMKTYQDLKEAIIHGAVNRIRPKMMTVMAIFMGLIPIMWSMGTGSDVMKRIAAPMIGGVFTSFLMGFIVYPVIYFIWKWHFEVKKRL